MIPLLAVLCLLAAPSVQGASGGWNLWGASSRSGAASVEDCEVCSSEELRHLRLLYSEHQARLSESYPNPDEEFESTPALASLSDQPGWATGASAHAQKESPGQAVEGRTSGGAKADSSTGPRRSLLQAGGGDLSASDLRSLIEDKEQEIKTAAMALKDLTKALSRQQMEVENLNKMLSMSKTDFKVSDLKDYRGGAKAGQLSDKTQEFVEQCQSNLAADLTSPENKDWAIYKGYACEATEAELKQYMTYDLRGLCPDDWFFVQHLIFVKNCYALPKRRCLARTPQGFIEPLPRAHALFNQRALADGSVRWNFHSCGSYECLNQRTAGDCKNCFNMTLEANRWRVRYRGSLTIREVVEMKGGALRLGLDAGRGTGSFAAHMARYNVTVMTMAMDIEARQGARKGLPYMETIAQRGLIPLHVPHTARLPFFDNTLDLVHCVNSVKYLPLGEFEDLLYEWDRVLRAGGIMWFELFYAPEDEMKVYVQIIELLKYRQLYWQITKKPLGETRGVPHVYLNAVIEKPARVDEPLAAPGTKSAKTQQA